MKYLSLILILSMLSVTAESQVYHQYSTDGHIEYKKQYKTDPSLIGYGNYKTTLDIYDRWSVELKGGVTKAYESFSTGYSNGLNSLQGDIGVRFMVTNLVGFRFDLGYNSFKSSKQSPDFHSQLLRTSFQLVLNAGSVFHFRTWTNRFGLSVHGGVGVATLIPNKQVSSMSSIDKLGSLMIGITPEVRVSKRFSVIADATLVGNIRQDYKFDGMGHISQRQKKQILSGSYSNYSVGLAYYFSGRK